MSGALIVILDSAGRIIGFNRACQQMSGYSFREVKGRAVWDFLLPPEEVDEAKATFASIVEGARAREHLRKNLDRKGRIPQGDRLLEHRAPWRGRRCQANHRHRYRHHPAQTRRRINYAEARTNSGD